MASGEWRVAWQVRGRRAKGESSIAKLRAARNVAASQKITGAYWFRLKIRGADGMPRKPGWPRYQSWAKHTKAKTEELALAA